MKNLIIITLLSAVLFSCKKKNDNPVNDPINPNATVLAKGDFTGNMSYTVSGSAEIINDNNQKKLVLKGFSTSNGPDLKVYLATTKQAGGFISLGTLKSTSGQQVYDINGMPDFAQHKFVLIWCQQFSVLFGAAELK